MNSNSASLENMKNLNDTTNVRNNDSNTTRDASRKPIFRNIHNTRSERVQICQEAESNRAKMSTRLRRCAYHITTVVFA
jgi:hypothetical protein